MRITGLAVRRDKKRVKKSILEGKENNQDRAHLHKSHKSTEDKESMNGDDHPTIHRTRKASGKKRIAPGLSLMETFTATNVKTSRLTVSNTIFIRFILIANTRTSSSQRMKEF